MLQNVTCGLWERCTERLLLLCGLYCRWKMVMGTTKTTQNSCKSDLKQPENTVFVGIICSFHATWSTFTRPASLGKTPVKKRDWYKYWWLESPIHKWSLAPSIEPPVSLLAKSALLFSVSEICIISYVEKRIYSKPCRRWAGLQLFVYKISENSEYDV